MGCEGGEGEEEGLKSRYCCWLDCECLFLGEEMWGGYFGIVSVTLFGLRVLSISSPPGRQSGCVTARVKL